MADSTFPNITSFVIRPANVHDAESIASVQFQGWQNTYRGIIADDYLDSMSLDEKYSMWKHILSGSMNRKFVDVLVNEADKVLGFISGGANRHAGVSAEGEILALYLMKDLQGKQLGKKLFTYGVNHLRQLGYNSFCLFVLSANPSLSFYRKFKPDSEQEVRVAIGGSDYPETALIWQDISRLGAEYRDVRQ
jgi:ribosomal protein S18 acetylase RimI-like enzyme